MLKVSKIESTFKKKKHDKKVENVKEKFLLQIIDMSNKVLYNKSLAEKSFLTLINAAVSHELSNPLNSLIN